LVRICLQEYAGNSDSEPDAALLKKLDDEARQPQLEVRERKKIASDALNKICQGGVDMSDQDVQETLSFILRVVFPHSNETEQAYRLEGIWRDAQISVGLGKSNDADRPHSIAPQQADGKDDPTAGSVTPSEVLHAALGALLKRIDTEQAAIDLIAARFTGFGNITPFLTKALELFSENRPVSELREHRFQEFHSFLDQPGNADEIRRQVLETALNRETSSNTAAL
jgi:hypothetical protein